MSEKDRLKKQFIKHIIYNICAFSIIFISFGVLVFSLIKSITYSSVDSTLQENAEKFYETENELLDLNKFLLRSSFGDITNSIVGDSLADIEDYILSKKVVDPKIAVIIRDENKKIINGKEAGFSFNEYLDKLDFNENNLNKFYEINLNEKYNYRGINLRINSNEKIRFIQLFINIDSEKMLVSHYAEILTSAVILGIVLSIIASFILSKETLMPIAESLEKQTEFVQNASHELRTPLTIIQAKQELLLQDPEAKIIDKSEEIILTLNETKRLTKLTKDLMLLARADENNIELNKEKADLDVLIENLVKPYMEMAELQEKKITLNLQYQEEAQIDVSKIYQVMVILLDNAIKYTESGDTIEIETSSKDGKCVIEVKDTGIGISDEAIKHIFDRFYREDKARNRSTGGSGLGLAIADAIVKAHGGTIKAMHNKPKGTIFVIKISK